MDVKMSIKHDEIKRFKEKLSKQVLSMKISKNISSIAEKEL